MSGDFEQIEHSGPVWQSCYTCRDYAEHRRGVIAEPLADKAIAEGRDVVEVVDEFMLAAHRRHLTGQPLRPGGPTRVIDPRLGRLAAFLATAFPDPFREEHP